MMPLSCGERAVRCLLGEPVDRIPFGVGIGWFPWWETRQRWQREAGEAELDFAAILGYDGGFALPTVHAGIFPEYAHIVLEENNDFRIVRDARGITLRERRDGGSMPEFLDYPVKGWGDWERLKAERLQLGTVGRLAVDWVSFRARLRETGEAVQVGTYPWHNFRYAAERLRDICHAH
jgi:uroporphyrinogen decarboxylase